MDALQRNQQRLKEAPSNGRPPFASKSNVIDLTSEDAFGPIPSSSQLSSPLQHGQLPPLTRPGQQRGIYPRPPGATSWRVPGRDKHSGPSKVKMFDPTSMHNSNEVVYSHTNLAKTPSAPQKITAQDVDLDRDAIDDEEPPPPMYGDNSAMTSSERDQQLQDMLSSMVNPPEAGDIDFEKAKNVQGLKCELMPHQVAGLLWMKEREGGRFKGGILADDMGLGKTVQMLALIIANSRTASDCTIDKIRMIAGEVSKKKKKDELEMGPEKVELKSKTTLILAPLAVIRQWEREANEKTSPSLRVLVHHGTARAKTAATFSKYDVVVTTYTTAASEWSNHSGEDKKKSKKKSKKTGGQIVVDSSDDDESDKESNDSDSSSDSEPIRGGLAKNRGGPIKKAPAPLFEANWLRIVLDEAQNIKNHRTKASIACAALSRNALSKWCLSGTPIQNDALEMFSLIRFLAIPPFNEYSHFREKISDPLKSNNQNRVNWGMKRLCVVLRSIMLRRTKDSTHDGKPLIVLPTRTINIVCNDFDNDNERQFYDGLESQVKKRLEAAEGEGQKVNQMATLLMLLRLRQACSHPSLLNRHVKTDAGAASGAQTVAPHHQPENESNKVVDDDDDGLADLLAGLSVVTKSCERCQAILTKEESTAKHCKSCREAIEKEKVKGIDWNTRGSTKIRVMLKLLEQIHKEGNEEKTIVFSQFTSFLDLVEPFLQQEKHNYVRYDGSMRADVREKNLETIRNDPSTSVILISFMAGSTGLNLTCCSRVILMDLWWNPQLEEQAFDRSHRLGQTKPVQIYKLYIKKSVEERILELQAKKRALAKAALEGSKFSKANKLDKKELMYLFSGAPMA